MVLFGYGTSHHPVIFVIFISLFLFFIMKKKKPFVLPFDLDVLFKKNEQKN